MTTNRNPMTYSMPTAVNVRNATGAALAAGVLVYISGYHIASGNVQVTAADADGAQGTNIAELVLPATIANGANGIAYQTCLLDGVLDTSGAAAGDPVYLSATAGACTLTVPTGAAVQQVVGRVVTLGSTATNGRILFHLLSPAGVRAPAQGRQGEINFPLAMARAIASNDIGVIAVGGAGTVGSGGILGSDGSTAPKLIRRNTSTDPTLDINWPATVVTELAWDFGVPLDMDVTVASTFTLLASMSGASNTPVVAVKCFTGVGGSNLGGNTAALAATEGAVTAAIAVNTLVNGQQGIVTLLPAAHGTDAIRLRRLYFTYTRK